MLAFTNCITGSEKSILSPEANSLNLIKNDKLDSNPCKNPALRAGCLVCSQYHCQNVPLSVNLKEVAYKDLGNITIIKKEICDFFLSCKVMEQLSPTSEVFPFLLQNN